MLKTREQAIRYRNWLLVSVAVFLIFEMLAVANMSTFGILSFIGFAMLLFPISYLLSKYQSWGSGAAGEENVVQMLGSMRDCYIIHDVMLPDMRGNIDHVVIAPTGLFVIETKNYKGTIRCTEDIWEVRSHKGRGRPYIRMERNPSRQVRRNAVMLHRFLTDRLGSSPWVNSIVCFTNPQCDIRLNHPRVPVLRPEWLQNFILADRQRILSDQEMTRIKNELQSSHR